MEKGAKKEETRARILAGAGRTFRSQGYGGAGVDGVAKAAGVTSGAFYAHFKSKAEAFREAVVVGMQDLEGAIRNLRRVAWVLSAEFRMCYPFFSWSAGSAPGAAS